MKLALCLLFIAVLLTSSTAALSSSRITMYGYMSPDCSGREQETTGELTKSSSTCVTIPFDTRSAMGVLTAAFRIQCLKPGADDYSIDLWLNECDGALKVGHMDGTSKDKCGMPLLGMFATMGTVSAKATCIWDCQVAEWGPWSACSASCDSAGQPHAIQTRTRNVLVNAHNGGTACPATVESRTCVPANPVCSVDCKMTEFSQWGACSKSCGEGALQTRSRSIIHSAQGAGKKCGPLEETRGCKVPACPVDCVVSTEWSDWSACSASCGGGTRRSVRTIITHPANGGKACEPIEKIESCAPMPCPINCQYSDWSAPSTCSTTCGPGTQTLTRTIKMQGSNGGVQCTEPLTKTVPCENVSPCPVDCKLSEWGPLSKCSKTCGGGEAVKTRKMISGPSNGGAACGDLTATEPCNNQPCPVDCKVGLWTTVGTCSMECGGGTVTQTRAITQSQVGNGAPCPSLSQTVPCNNDPCPIDCVVADVWGDWTACSAPCGTSGTQVRSRAIVTPNSNGGKSCPTLSETRSCNAQACPPQRKPCLVHSWGPWTKCSQACGAGGTRQRVANATGDCTPDMLKQEEVCNQNVVCPVDAVVSPWSPWSECSVSCGGGSRSRERKLITASLGAGKPAGALLETEDCNIQTCVPSEPQKACVYSEFSAWGPCSKSCGAGSKTRTRKLDHGDAAVCSEPLVETASCQEAMCKVDCAYSQWGDWGPCSAQCGIGVRQRQRSIKTPASGGGKECGENLQESQECQAAKGCPVDCRPSEWTVFSACSKPCGGGNRTRTRAIDIEASNGGKPCRVMSESVPCNTQACPVDCVTSPWSAYTPCSEHGVTTKVRKVITEPQHGGAECGELSVTLQCDKPPFSKGPSPQPILPPPEKPMPTKRDCVVTPWSPFSDCSAAHCGTSATQFRVRDVVTTAAAGGKICPPLREERPCAAHPVCQCHVSCCQQNTCADHCHQSLCVAKMTLQP